MSLYGSFEKTFEEALSRDEATREEEKEKQAANVRNI